MELSMNTSFVQESTPVERCLRLISEAGFRHIQWIYDSANDYIYSVPETRQVEGWLRQFGLVMDDIHGTTGIRKNYMSFNEYERQAGVDLIKNRVEFAAFLGAEVIVLHLHTPRELIGSSNARKLYERAFRSFDELEGFCIRKSVKIAVEYPDIPEFGEQSNLLSEILGRYDPGFLGLCYDSGHANCLLKKDRESIDILNMFRDRLISVHFHDNDGSADQHRLPFTGTFDWNGLARVLAGSPYNKCFTLEPVIWRSELTDEKLFLDEAYSRGRKIADMIDKYRQL